jgi:hypothetical protein
MRWPQRSRRATASPTGRWHRPFSQRMTPMTHRSDPPAHPRGQAHKAGDRLDVDAAPTGSSPTASPATTASPYPSPAQGDGHPLTHPTHHHPTQGIQA